MAERKLWEERPSQAANWPVFLSTGALALAAAVGGSVVAPVLGIERLPLWGAIAAMTLLVGGFHWLALYCTRYWLTSERLFIRHGILSVVEDQIELYRVKDYRVQRPFWLRIVGRGNLTVYTSDRNQPTFSLFALENPERLAQGLRKLVERARRRHAVREID